MKNTLKILGIIALAALIGFTVIGCKKDASKASAPAASAASATPAAPAASASVDNFLTEFEAFVNEAADTMQKMLSGDLTAATKAAALGTKAEEMATRWGSLSADDLTPAQQQRFDALEDKLTKALGLE